MHYPKITLIILILCQYTSASSQPLPPLTDSIHSKILNETRGIQVIMPEEYKPGSKEKYEIVYILDGEWYWDLVPFTYNFAASANYIPKSIFVLIRNRYLNGVNLRGRDFTPTKVTPDSSTGGADRFDDFVKKEVVPYIENKYPSNGQRTLVGSSASGLFCVYAFVKDPAFFQSYVASDPSIGYDNHYVPRITKKTLDNMPASPGTIYIGGLLATYRYTGIFQFDSVLKAHAPKSLHYKIVNYPDESHYSVQLKAFYDAFRFSHYGYAQKPPEFHPMRGVINSDKPFMIYFNNDNPGLRFTADGSVPDTSSRLMRRNENVMITTPATLRLKTFGNRKTYSGEWTTKYEKGKIDPPKPDRSNKRGLNYMVYKGTWDSIPTNTSLLKADQSGVADSSFKFNTLRDKVPFLLVVEGMLDVPADAEYVFYAKGYDAIELSFAGRNLFKAGDAKVQPSNSFVASLSKGRYPMRMVMSKKTLEPEPDFIIFQSRPGSDKWWEMELLSF